ncbi:inner membrane CreD family protein [Luteibacter sp.]|jgi:inner membrane protein|uniref:inner membrane CreD family protein n=1 Tax=Luteibacter sp. TaxID=1886636 RepID=UPI002F3F96E4
MFRWTQSITAKVLGIGMRALIKLIPLLYGLIGAEQYALLIGSVVLVTVIGLLMYLTRRIDWYAQTTPPPIPDTP